jgi:hypothetical protein
VNREAKFSRAYRFKEWFINEIETILSNRPKVIAESDVEHVKVVDAIFAFKNSSLVSKLIKRG